VRLGRLDEDEDALGRIAVLAVSLASRNGSCSSGRTFISGRLPVPAPRVGGTHKASHRKPPAHSKRRASETFCASYLVAGTPRHAAWA